jgi:small subunit ribosomal protein S1
MRRDRPATRTEPLPPVEDITARAPNLQDLNREIEADLEAALADFSGVDLLGAKPAKRPAGAPQPEVNRKVGRVLAIHGADVFIDVPGGRGQGVLPLEQFDGQTPAIGTEVEFEIKGYDGANGLLILTRRGAAQHADWSTLTVGMVVEARVTESNRGGLAVEVNGIRGFMPISQIDLYRVEDTQQFINQRLKCEVTEVNPRERNLVVSRRNVLEREREEQKAKFWDEIAEGQTRSGMVKSIHDFGVFVNLGAADGMIPISELAWARVRHPSDLVTVGQNVQVKVVRLDRETRKIGLSLKQMSASPWSTVETEIAVGDVVNGKVTRTADFGAFLEIAPGVEGLAHISELATHRVRRVSEVLQVGQVVPVKVLSIDPVNRKISLSVKAAMAPPPDEPKPADGPVETEEAPEPDCPAKPRNIALRGGVGNEWKLPEG